MLQRAPLPLHAVIWAAFCAFGQGTPLHAQDTPVQQSPLSVIDWLGNQVLPPSTVALPVPDAEVDEPPVAESGTVPAITTQPLTEGAPREIGLVPTDVTGLPNTLWAGSDPDRLISLIGDLADPSLPAAQSLLYTVLLSEALAPAGDGSAGDALALARVEKLMTLGALEPALALIEQTGVTTSSAHFDLWMQIALLTGTEDRACSVLLHNTHLTQQYGTRIFCAARDQQWDNAALTFGSAQALKLLPQQKLDLLDRFLHPEAFDGAAPLPPPRAMDPLTFRLFETIGEPLPTRNLPRAFAVADLRDLAGWKSQLEAAERLTRAGALPDNRLLGLYTDREPAASGGVWDRVEALQRFDTALAAKSELAVTKTLPAAWAAMTEAELETTFARLFAEQLAPMSLQGRAGDIAQKVALLSPAYESAATKPTRPQLAGYVARGEVPSDRPTTPRAGGIYDAFAGAAPRADLVAMVRQDRLGEVVLLALDLVQDGSEGNATALRDGLATLRTLGLEDTARQAALQLLLLER